MPSNLPYIQFWVADYFSETAHLTTEQHGAYSQLIFRYWQRQGPFPDDDKFLARIVGLGPRQWKRHRDAIADLFEIVNGTWRHRRTEEQLQAARDKVLKNKCAAEASVRKRFGERSTDAKRPSSPTESEPETYSLETSSKHSARVDAQGSKNLSQGRGPGIEDASPIEFAETGEESVMQMVREDLLRRMGRRTYERLVKPCRLVREEGRLMVYHPPRSPAVERQLRDSEMVLRAAAEAIGFDTAWIKEDA